METNKANGGPALMVGQGSTPLEEVISNRDLKIPSY